MRLSPGQDGDGPHGRELLESFKPGQVGNVVGDTAYDGDETRKQVRKLKAAACIKPSPNRTSRKRYDKTRYRNRNQVERFFNRIKQFRRIATRYDKTVENYSGFVWIAALMTTAI